MSPPWGYDVAAQSGREGARAALNALKVNLGDLIEAECHDASGVTQGTGLYSVQQILPSVP